MKRLSTISAVLLIGVIGFIVFRTDVGRPGHDAATGVWYRESDVSLLSRTGRPQLVEFFHPT